MDTIEDILHDKGSDVYVVEPGAAVLDAVRTMCARHVGALLVARDEATLGVISERDVLVRVVLAGRDPAQTAVEDVMTRGVLAVRPQTTTREAMEVMTERHCRHLPVVGEGAVVGMVSIGDLVRRASREQASEIQVLTDYVRGVYG